MPKRIASVPACLIDTCVWLALNFEGHPHHHQARSALLAATPAEPWLWCRASQQSFLRLASTPALLKACRVTRGTNRDAITALQALIALKQVAVVDEPPGLMGRWLSLASLDQPAPKRWMDAYLAAMAISGGWQLISLDRDFLAYQKEGLNLQLLPTSSAHPPP